MTVIDFMSNILNPETEIKTETDMKWYENWNENENVF